MSYSVFLSVKMNNVLQYFWRSVVMVVTILYDILITHAHHLQFYICEIKIKNITNFTLEPTSNFQQTLFAVLVYVYISFTLLKTLQARWSRIGRLHI